MDCAIIPSRIVLRHSLRRRPGKKQVLTQIFSEKADSYWPIASGISTTRTLCGGSSRSGRLSVWPDMTLEKDQTYFFRISRGYTPFDKDCTSGPVVPIGDHEIYSVDKGMTGTPATYIVGFFPQACANWYRLTGSDAARDLGRGLAEYLHQHGEILDPDTGRNLMDHYAHLSHSMVSNLAYALAVQDKEMIKWVRRGFEYQIRMRDPEGTGILASDPTCSCFVPDMINVGIMLSQAGEGDYWDDVDYIVRNRLAAMQFSDIERMCKSCDDMTDESREIVERCLGAFSVGRAGYAPPAEWGCCTANGTYALYYAWHGITRFQDDVATVNLFMNRASEWMDVHSYLPYEGKVVLKNKQARTALVRIPSWVAMHEVRSLVNQQAVKPAAAGRYLVFQDLQPKAEIVLTFPIVERPGKYFIHNKEFTATFHGSTVIQIDPPVALDDQRDKYYWSLYEWGHAQEDFTAGRTPTKTTKQFVPASLLPLQ